MIWCLMIEGRYLIYMVGIDTMEDVNLSCYAVSQDKWQFKILKMYQLQHMPDKCNIF